jgi:hypothetical protein
LNVTAVPLVSTWNWSTASTEIPNERFRPSPWTTALVIGMPSTYMSVVKSWPPMTLPQRPIDWTPGIRNMKAVGSRGPPVFSTIGSAV